MTLTIDNEYTGSDFESAFSFDFQKTAEAVIEAVLQSEHCPFAAEVNIMFVDDERIREINLETRKIDRATDVLSFPMLEYQTPADFSWLKTDSADFFDPDNGELVLGDIVLSIPHILSQAEEYGHSVKREYAFLVAHSMFHLLGYDHMTEEDERVMFHKQEDILNKLHITREGDHS